MKREYGILSFQSRPSSLIQSSLYLFFSSYVHPPYKSFRFEPSQISYFAPLLAQKSDFLEFRICDWWQDHSQDWELFPIDDEIGRTQAELLQSLQSQPLDR